MGFSGGSGLEREGIADSRGRRSRWGKAALYTGRVSPTRGPEAPGPHGSERRREASPAAGPPGADACRAPTGGGQIRSRRLVRPDVVDLGPTVSETSLETLGGWGSGLGHWVGCGPAAADWIRFGRAGGPTGGLPGPRVSGKGREVGARPAHARVIGRGRRRRVVASGLVGSGCRFTGCFALHRFDASSRPFSFDEGYKKTHSTFHVIFFSFSY